MCIGIPGEIIDIDGNAGVVKVGELHLTVGLDLVPEVVVGDFVLIHAGYAVQTIDPEEAAATWDLIKEFVVYEKD